MDISTLTDAVDEMCRTWTAFQHENDRTTGRNEESLDKMNARMNQLETAVRRERRTPTSSGDAREYGPETKAYFDYLRHGTRDEPTPGVEALTQATSGNIRFIARRRVGGQVVLAEAIRKLKVAV